MRGLRWTALVLAVLLVGWPVVGAFGVVALGLPDPIALLLSAGLWAWGIRRIAHRRGVRADRAACWSHRTGMSPMLAGEGDRLCTRGPQPCRDRALRMARLEAQVLGPDPFSVAVPPELLRTGDPELLTPQFRPINPRRKASDYRREFGEIPDYEDEFWGHSGTEGPHGPMP